MLFLLGREASKHVVDLSASGKVVADAEAQAAIALGAEFGGYVLEAVVSGVAATLAQADGAEWQGDVVDEHQQAVERQLLVVHPEAHGRAAEVHVCGGLEHHQLAVLDAHAGHGAVAAALESCAARVGGHQLVGYHEAGVVAGADVLGADVAQSHYQEFFHVRL